MAAGKKSLWQNYPSRVDIFLYLLGLITLLVVAQLTPVLSVKKFVFWKSSYSLWSGMIGLFRDRHYVLAVILLVFSILFPFTKLVVLTSLWVGRFSDAQRRNVLKWLERLGRWSMLDVFVVAMVVVIAKTGGALQASPRLGIYLFATAVLLSMILTRYIHHLALKLSKKQMAE